jgi:hypothetical protein
MTNTNVQPASEYDDTAYFGICPDCHQPFRVCRHVGGENWFCCDVCRTCWLFGLNVISDASDSRPEDWEATAALLETYREVTPEWPADERETAGAPMSTSNGATPGGRTGMPAVEALKSRSHA